MGGGVAVVTGAGRGIGLGIAEALGASGRRVVLTDVDEERVRREAERLNGAGMEVYAALLDVRDGVKWGEVIGGVIERWGRLDVLVNNAGISPRGTAETTDEALWDLTMAINLKGAWLGIKTALPHLRESKGTIVNVGSTHATLPLRNLCVYVASKAGLLGLTRQVAIEYLHDGVRCNMVAPGWVATPGEKAIQAAAGKVDFPEGIDQMTSPADVGGAVVYLASEPGRRMNGAILYLDGGLHAFGDVRWVHFADGVRAE